MKMGDLKSAKAIYFKATLFLLCGLIAASVLFVQNPSLSTAFLLSILVWSFCRLYYFMFYVIQHYVDPEFHFSGIIPCLIYLFKKKRQRP
jgi:hypothetical protein